MQAGERQQFDSLLYLQFSSAQQGLVTASEETLLTLRWTLGHPGGREWWTEYKSLFTEQMQEYDQDLNVE